MTDKEIKSALEGAILNSKRYDSKVWSIEVYKLENTFDLITRQKSEIKRLQSMNQANLDTIHGLQAEIDYLRAELKRGCAERRDAHTCINNFTKFESILDFAERLKQKAVGLKLVNRDYRFVSVKEIDSLVIKMSGETHEW